MPAENLSPFRLKPVSLRLLSSFKGICGSLVLRLILGAALFGFVGCRKSLPVVTISSDMVHVTAISLGQTRLAIINGKQLAEGNELAVPPARLRIVKISDGQVELSNGNQKITAPLETSKRKAPKR
jgi:hypothetical protein